MKTCRSVFLFLAMAMLSWGAHAQSTDGIDPYEEYGKHLRAAQDVTPLKSDQFGDQVSLYNGQTEFDVTDIDLPGNSDLPVRLQRRLDINDRRKVPGNLGGMGEWDLEVPYIDGTFTQQNGWTIGGDANLSQARCSDQGSPPDTYVPPFTNEGDYATVWDGNRMHIPGGVDDELLVNTEAKLPAMADGNTYPWVTKSYYRLGCLATTNGLAGESFYAVSPSGDKYTFNWALVHTAPALNVGQSTFLNRSRIFLLATEVQDRFGNWVKYTYNSSNQLKAITANDGREIDITWSGNTVTSAQAGSRTWSYGYNGGMLSSVTRPDGSTWKYAVLSGALATTKVFDKNDGPPPNTHCQLEPPANTGALVYQVNAPSGAQATFTFNYQRHYRNAVPFSCIDGNPDHLYPEVYNFFDNFSLTSKQITGAGLSTLNWTYDYADGTEGFYFTPSLAGPINGNEETYIPQGLCATCLTSKVVTVTEPGDLIKYTFGSTYANNEGRLLQTETDSPAGQAVKTVSNTYLADDQIANEPFPDNAGRSVLPIWKNPMVARIRPVVLTTTTQDGDTYSNQTEAFDAFAQPTLTKRSNSIAGQQAIEEQTTYDNDLTHWVLGLTQEVESLSATGNIIESQRVYDPATALMQSQSRFGEQLLSYTYNSAGQLASFMDGNSQTTALGNYYRGIPQLIDYPDGTSQSATVDDYGEITAVTDQAGHTTHYTYDPSGWPKEIDYPTGDEAAWLPETFQFTYITTAERGIPAGHWRRTVSTGNNVEVTYFDAMLRPLLTDGSITGTTGSDITAANSYDWRGLTTYTSYPVSSALDLPTLTAGAQAIGTRTTYDTLGRPLQVQQDSELGGPLTSSTAYLQGAAVQVTDPRGKVTTTHYQVFGAPSTSAPIEVDAPEGVTQTITRDIFGKPLSITQSGIYNRTETDSITKTLVYDIYQRLCRTTEPETGDSSISYDGANNVRQTVSGLTLTEAGCARDQVPSASAINYTHDAMNRLQTVLPPAGTQSTTYHYTPTGNLDQAVSGNSTWSAHYNYRDMLTDETLTLTGQYPWTIADAHDTYGNLAQITYPDGESVAYNPNPRGRARQVGTYAGSFAYFLNGEVSGFIYGNGTAYVAAQNTRQLLSNFSYGNGSTVNLSEDLSYDPNGNILTVQDLVGGQRSKTFQYDDLNRLTSAVAPALWGTETYTYDPLNNLRTRLTAGQTNVYNYGPTNQLANITRAGSTLGSFGYDNLGNETSRNGATLQFDQKNQLLQIPGVDTYQYDAAGRRTTKTSVSGGASTYTFYDHAGQLMYQYEPATMTWTNFIRLGSRLIARNVGYATPVVTVPAISGTGSYAVSWSGASGATSYTLQEQVNGGSWSTIQSGSSTSLAISGKGNGTYGYHVQACNAGGCGPWSAVVSTMVLLPPPPPASVTVPATSSGTVTVGWAASATASTYTLQHANYGITGWSNLYSGAATSYVSHETTTGTWIYQVQACNAGGCSAFIVSSGGTAVTIPPASAPSLSAPSTNHTGCYTVSWSAVAGATSYTLQQQVNGAAWTTIQSSSAISLVTSGETNANYGYRTQACNVGGCGPWSGTGTVAVTLPPAPPATVTAPSYVHGVQYYVTWSASTGASSYNVQRTNTTSTIIATTAATTTTIPAPNSSQSLQYAVQACNAAGCSAFQYAPNGTQTDPPGPIQIAPGTPARHPEGGR